MVVAMTSGYTGDIAPTPPYPPEVALQLSEEFRTLLVGDVVPFMDATYRTLAEPESRAIAGLSMGGRQALHAGLTSPHIFANVVAFSAAVFNLIDPITAYDGALADADAFNERTKVLWLSAGTGEHRFHQAVTTISKALHDHHIRHHTHLVDGTGHEWRTWRRSLEAAAPLLFRT